MLFDICAHMKENPDSNLQRRTYCRCCVSATWLSMSNRTLLRISVNVDALQCLQVSRTVTARHTFPRMHHWCPRWNVLRACHEPGCWRVFMRASEWKGSGLLILRDSVWSWIRRCLLGWWNPLVICHRCNMESQPFSLSLDFQYKDKKLVQCLCICVNRCLCNFPPRIVICCIVCMFSVCGKTQQRSHLIFQTLINLSKGGRIFVTTYIFNNTRAAGVGPGGGWVWDFCVCLHNFRLRVIFVNVYPTFYTVTVRQSRFSECG